MCVQNCAFAINCVFATSWVSVIYCVFAINWVSAIE